MRNLYLLVLVVLTAINVKAQNFEAFLPNEFVQDNDTLNYRILYPQNMEEGKKYPLILFLHGAGERGVNNEKQLIHGAALFVDEEGRPTQEAIVILPQCPPDVMWTHRVKEKNKEGVWEFRFPLGDSAPRPAQLVNLLVEDLMASGQVDTNHMYVMGLSMGGIGTLEFLYRWPEKYAAAICICGGHDPALAEKYCHVPVWFFHGGKDDVVPSVYSRQVFDVLKKCNVNTRYTFFPELNHNSWDAAFSEPELLEWLLSF